MALAPTSGAGAAGAARTARTATRVDGVPLVAISGAQRARCRSYADALRRPVLCPGLLPVPLPVPATYPAAQCFKTEIGEDSCGPAFFEVTPPELLVNQSNFAVPHSYVGVPGLTSVTGGPLGHFVFVEAPVVKFYEGSGAKPKVVHVPSTCHAVRLRSPLRVRAAVARLYRCAPGPMTPDTPALYLGHELLTFEARGLHVQVSFHGQSSVNVDLDLAVARSASVVMPRRR